MVLAQAGESIRSISQAQESSRLPPASLSWGCGGSGESLFTPFPSPGDSDQNSGQPSDQDLREPHSFGSQ